MLHKIGFFISGLALCISCNSNTTTDDKYTDLAKADTVEVESDKCSVVFKEAKRMDDILLKATVVDNGVASEAIKAFAEFSNTCKSDSLAPIFLVKAGQVAQSIKRYTQAQSFFVKCAEDYPKFKNRGAALFLLAQLYDNASMLNNEQEARTIYEQIIREYPKTTFAEDSKAAINNLGKTDEQLIEEFLKKNK